MNKPMRILRECSSTCLGFKQDNLLYNQQGVQSVITDVLFFLFEVNVAF